MGPVRSGRARTRGKPGVGHSAIADEQTDTNIKSKNTWLAMVALTQYCNFLKLYIMEI